MNGSETPTTVLIIDDHALVRSGLRMLIESRPGLSVVGEAGSREEALRIAFETRPDIVLLDLDLGGDSGLDFLPKLLESSDHGRVLVLTGLNDPEVHRRAIHEGAVGVVLKEKAAEVLIKAIEKVREGEVWLERSLMSRVISDWSRSKKPDPEAPKIATLTTRERELINLVCEGLRNREIAEKLFISEATVRHHLTSIFGKLAVADRLELILYAFRQGLAKAPPGPGR